MISTEDESMAMNTFALMAMNHLALMAGGRVKTWQCTGVGK